jgi:hypothetical protein
MHPLVRDLYRRFLVVGRDYPLGLPYVRGKAKEAIQRNRSVTDEDELMRAVYKGRWWVKELVGVIQLKKYRAMRRSYGGGETGAGGAATSSTPATAATAATTLEGAVKDLDRRAAEEAKAAASKADARERGEGSGGAGPGALR